MDTRGIAKHLKLIADLKVLDGANRFSIAAYQDAAKKIESATTQDLNTLIQGLGAKTALAVQQYIDTGTSDTYTELATKLPVECLTMTVVPGIGPKKAFGFYQEGIRNFDMLVKLAEAGALKSKLNQDVLFARDIGTGRIAYKSAQPVAETLIEAIRKIPVVVHAEVVGSYRRKSSTVKDLDVLVAVKSGAKFTQAQNIADAVDTKRIFGTVADALKGCGVLESVLNDGVVKREFRVQQYGVTLKADVWIVDVSYWGSALNYSTGSKAHNIALRKLAQAKGLKINEYGIWRGDVRLGGEDERDVYELLGIDWVPPEKRES